MEHENILIKAIKNPQKILIYFLSHSAYGRSIDDAEYLKRMYKLYFGQDLNLDHPVLFNEKMQWMKIHCRESVYTKMADKYEMKSIVDSIAGDGHVFPVIGIFDRFENIDFSKLPDRFVLKTTHDSGSVIICRDKKSLDIKATERKINKSLKRNYYYIGREWPYKNIKPRIIVEKYMEDKKTGKELNDYKFFLFNGRVEYIQVDYDRFTNHKRNFYDREWEYVPFTTCYPTDENVKCERPSCLEEMIEISEKIAGQDKMPPFLRVDCYAVEDRAYVGEITFFHGGGMEIFYPSEYNTILGEKLKLR